MKLKSAPRVVYEHNPLVEVVCQIRFDRRMELTTAPPAQFSEEFARERYPLKREERAAALQIVFGQGTEQLENLPTAPNAAIPVTYHFASSDESKRISINAEFFAFTCGKYERWETFKGEFLEGFSAFQKCHPNLAVNRVGLRYRDLIERENLGLEGVPWRDLLSSAIAGIFLGDLFMDSGYEIGELQQSTQAKVTLDDCSMLLQTALLRSSHEKPREAFLIDADFFHEQPRYPVDASSIDQTLEVLHQNAGSLFRHCIKDPLHDALRPSPV